MKHLILFFLLLPLTVSGQSIDLDIKNTKTSKHINIPTTKLYIIPPPNFEVAETFVGLQKSESSVFAVQELVGGNFYTNAATFSRAEFERQGIIVSDYLEIKVNGYPAKYISMQKSLFTKTFALVFGDTTFSTMIMIKNPIEDKQTEKEIIESMNTIYYDKSKRSDPFENAPFFLDDKKSKFKFCRSNANVFMYTVGGTENTKGGNPFILVTPFPKDIGMTSNDVASIMIDKQVQYGFSYSKTKNSSTNTSGDSDIYEAEVYGQMQGESAVIYQYIIIKRDQVISIQGIAKNEMEENIKQFKDLAHSIQIK
jgi:hypothetical protein